MPRASVLASQAKPISGLTFLSSGSPTNSPVTISAPTHKEHVPRLPLDRLCPKLSPSTPFSRISDEAARSYHRTAQTEPLPPRSLMDITSNAQQRLYTTSLMQPPRPSHARFQDILAAANVVANAPIYRLPSEHSPPTSPSPTSFHHKLSSANRFSRSGPTLTPTQDSLTPGNQPALPTFRDMLRTDSLRSDLCNDSCTSDHSSTTSDASASASTSTSTTTSSPPQPPPSQVSSPPTLNSLPTSPDLDVEHCTPDLNLACSPEVLPSPPDIWELDSPYKSCDGSGIPDIAPPSLQQWETQLFRRRLFSDSPDSPPTKLPSTSPLTAPTLIVPPITDKHPRSWLSSVTNRSNAASFTLPVYHASAVPSATPSSDTQSDSIFLSTPSFTCTPSRASSSDEPRYPSTLLDVPYTSASVRTPDTWDHPEPLAIASATPSVVSSISHSSFPATTSKLVQFPSFPGKADKDLTTTSTLSSIFDAGSSSSALGISSAIDCVQDSAFNGVHTPKHQPQDHLDKCSSSLMLTQPSPYLHVSSPGTSSIDALLSEHESDSSIDGSPNPYIRLTTIETHDYSPSDSAHPGETLLLRSGNCPDLSSSHGILNTGHPRKMSRFKGTIASWSTKLSRHATKGQEGRVSNAASRVMRSLRKRSTSLGQSMRRIQNTNTIPPLKGGDNDREMAELSQGDRGQITWTPTRYERNHL